ncbi:hypothetical protein Dimus_009073 [Dionaea muscipula]
MDGWMECLQQLGTKCCSFSLKKGGGCCSSKLDLLELDDAFVSFLKNFVYYRVQMWLVYICLAKRIIRLFCLLMPKGQRVCFSIFGSECSLNLRACTLVHSLPSFTIYPLFLSTFKQSLYNSLTIHPL